MLQVALFQLPDVTLMVSVYNKKSMKKKEMIGWFSLGKALVTFMCSQTFAVKMSPASCM